MEQDNKKTIIAIIIILIVLALIYFGYRSWPRSDSEQGNVEDAASLFNQENVNPFEESTNPYENVKTNPFE